MFIRAPRSFHRHWRDRTPQLSSNPIAPHPSAPASFPSAAAPPLPGPWPAAPAEQWYTKNAGSGSRAAAARAAERCRVVQCALCRAANLSSSRRGRQSRAAGTSWRSHHLSRAFRRSYCSAPCCSSAVAAAAPPSDLHMSREGHGQAGGGGGGRRIGAPRCCGTVKGRDQVSWAGTAPLQGARAGCPCRPHEPASKGCCGTRLACLCPPHRSPRPSTSLPSPPAAVV